MNFVYFTPAIIGYNTAKKAKRIKNAWIKKSSDKPLKSALETILENIKRNGYLQYGFYWWAVKSLLIEEGLLPADYKIKDEVVEGIYKANTPMETIVLASDFSLYYNSTYFQNTREFPINETETYQLYDEEMEVLFSP